MMKMYIDTFRDNIKKTVYENPHQVFVGLGVFCTVIMGTAVQHVASGVFGLFFLASFFVVNKWKRIWRELSKGEKIWLMGFACYAMSGVIAYINVQDVSEYIKILERYIRFLLVIPMYLYLKYYKVNVLNYLYVGAIASGPFLLLIALNSYFEHPMLPARGYYHHIIFGSVAMLNVGVMLTILMTVRLRMVLKIIIIICMLCGLATVALSQARGVWLVLPVYLLVTIYYSMKFSKPKLLLAIMAGLLIFVGGLITFQGDMVGKRIDQAVDEVQTYYTDNKYKSSLGTRLAMWEIAIDVWSENPLLGTGPGDFDEEIRARQVQGEFKGMRIFTSTHNIYFQALVNAGMLGLVVMLLVLFYLPYKLVSDSKGRRESQYVLSLIVILTFATVGIGESWTLRLSIISVYITYIMVLASSLFTGEKSRDDFGVTV